VVDLGSPAYILASKGNTEDSKTNISDLATAMEMFGDFKWLGKSICHRKKRVPYNSRPLLSTSKKLLLYMAITGQSPTPNSKQQYRISKQHWHPICCLLQMTITSPLPQLPNVKLAPSQIQPYIDKRQMPQCKKNNHSSC